VAQQENQSELQRRTCQFALFTSHVFVVFVPFAQLLLQAQTHLILPPENESKVGQIA
jgi:hypothetical protein